MALREDVDVVEHDDAASARTGTRRYTRYLRGPIFPSPLLIDDAEYHPIVITPRSDMPPHRHLRSLGALAITSRLVACAPDKGDATSDASENASTTTGTTTDPSTPTTTEAPCADVIAGDLMISDATDPATLACVIEVQGELRVADTTTWSDLAPLANLRRVGGDLKLLNNTALLDLDGLQALERVGGLVSFANNPQLADLSSLAGLRRLGGLGIHDNALTSLAGLAGDLVFEPAIGGPAGIFITHEALTDLDGLAAITSTSAPLGLHVTVSEMPALVDIAGLGVLAVVDGPVELSLHDLPVLPGLHWPGPLERLQLRDAPVLQQLELPAVIDAREISLWRLPALTGLTGLAALRSISELLHIGPCGTEDGLASVVDLHGLEALEQVEVLYVEGNASLTSLAGLPTTLQAGNVFIRRNPALPQADADAWLDAAGPSGFLSEACENLAGPACAVGCPIIASALPARVR